MELEARGDWAHRFRSALVTDPEKAVDSAHRFDTTLKSGIRSWLKDFESSVPKKYRAEPRIDYLEDKHQVFPDLNPGVYALGLSLAVYVRDNGPTEELERIGGEFPEVYEVANYFIDNLNEHTRYERRERKAGTLVLCDLPPSVVPDSELLAPLKKKLEGDSPEMVMRGLTKAFLVSKTGYREKSSEAVVRAVSDVSAKVVDDNFSPPSYEPEFKRELMHPLSSMFYALLDQFSGGEAVARLRESAGRAVERCENGSDPRVAVRRSVEECAAGMEFGDIERLEETARATRIAQKYALNYLIYLGIIDESRAEQHYFWSSEPKLFQGRGLEGSLHLEQIVEGLEALERKAVAHDRREAKALVKLAREFKRLVKDLEDEVALVKQIEASVLDDRQSVEGVAERLKQDFADENITTPENIRALRRTNPEVFKHILDQYFKMVHYCYQVNADILKVLEQIHGDEKQVRSIIEQNGYREVDEINRLIELTEQDFRRVRKAQEILGKLRDYLEDKR